MKTNDTPTPFTPARRRLLLALVVAENAVDQLVDELRQAPLALVGVVVLGAVWFVVRA